MPQTQGAILALIYGRRADAAVQLYLEAPVVVGVCCQLTLNAASSTLVEEAALARRRYYFLTIAEHRPLGLEIPYRAKYQKIWY